MAADFNQPTVSGQYTDIPGQIRDNFSAAVTMHETDASSNKPTAAKQITSTGVIKRWNGSTWVQLADPAGHAASTSNPHSVTAAQAGAPIINHSHNATGSEGPKLSQANSHESADTDSGSSSLHHTLGTGANQAAAGNHSHAYSTVTVGSNARAAGSTTNATSLEVSVSLTNVASGTAQPMVHLSFFANAVESTDLLSISGVVAIDPGGNNVEISGVLTHPRDAGNGIGIVSGQLASQRTSTSYAYASFTNYGTVSQTVRIGYKKGASDNECYLVIDDNGSTTWDNLVLVVTGYSIKVA